MTEKWYNPQDQQPPVEKAVLVKIPGAEKPRTGWLGKDGTWKNSSGVIYPTAWSFYKKEEAKADTAQEVDNVNHPKHYTSDPSGVECIQITIFG